MNRDECLQLAVGVGVRSRVLLDDTDDSTSTTRRSRRTELRE